MKVIGLMLIVSLLVVVPAMGAVNNVSLSASEGSGITGTASAITGALGGVTPHTHLELNAQMSRLPDQNMVYQGWLIDNSTNTKQSLGVFEGNNLNADMTLTAFSANGPWDAIAVSMEPANDTNPAPSKIVAMGSLPGTAVSASNFMSVAVLPPDEPFQRQLVMQQYGLTADQYASLRMQGLRVRDITLSANIARQCNQSVMDAADVYMRNGGNLSAVASACNTTVASILTPSPMQSVAGATQEIGPMTRPGTVGAGATGMPMVTMPSYYLMTPAGTPLLTESQWRSYERRGFDWVDVAIAANISSMTGDNMDDLLRMVRVQGQLWRDIAFERGLDPDRVFDVSAWPFNRGELSASQARVLEREGGSAGMAPGTAMPGSTGAGTTNPPSNPNAPNY